MEGSVTCYQFSNQYDGDEACLNLVYYTQVEAVRELIKRAKHIPSIQYIILFGSSITMACGRDSDIDILIIADEYDEEYSLIQALRKGIKKSMDIIPETLEHFKEALETGNILYREIKEKGIIIYERTT